MPIAEAAIEPLRDEDNQRGEREEQIKVQMHRRERDAEDILRRTQRRVCDTDRIDAADALRAVGQIDGRIQVIQEDADDFAEAQRDDG
jgi:hypothetical protein